MNYAQISALAALIFTVFMTALVTGFSIYTDYEVETLRLQQSRSLASCRATAAELRGQLAKDRVLLTRAEKALRECYE